MIVVTFALIFSVGARLRIDTDVWWHLRVGDYILEHGFIRHDSFSHTVAGAAWIDHSWGAEVLSQLAWRAGGYGALELVTGLLALGGAVLVYRMSPGGVYLRCAAAGYASLTASVFWSPRPQMVSYLLTALVLYVLFLCRHRQRDVLWTLPLILLVWANLHGGFAIGLLLIAGTLAGELLERVVPLDDRGHVDRPTLLRLGLVGGLSLGAVCINPYGPRLLAVPFETANGSFARLIEEWGPPDLHHRSFWPFAGMVVLLLLSIGASPKRLGWSDGLLCGSMLLLALSAARNISMFAVVATPVLAYHLAAWFQERGWKVRTLGRASAPIALVNIVLISFALGIAVRSVSASFRDAELETAKRAELPVDAVAYLREQGVRGQLFNTYDWGGYVIHALPDVPVFVDGRSDLYGADFLYKPYLFIAGGGPGWEAHLDSYRVGTVLVRRTDGLAKVLGESRSWRSAYSDDLAIVFERA
jgi:hypothetical protein